MKTKLEVKKVAGKRKPDFTRQQSSYSKFRDDKWRYPRGKSSKVRMKRLGHKVPPSIGFGSPLEWRNLNKYGMAEVVVSNEHDLKHLHVAKHAIVLSSKLGLRKKLILLEKIKEHKFHVANIDDVDEFIKNAHAGMGKRKEEKQKLLSKKDASKKKAEKVQAKEVKPEEKPEMTEEEKQKQIKEEERKVLEAKV